MADKKSNLFIQRPRKGAFIFEENGDNLVFHISHRKIQHMFIFLIPGAVYRAYRIPYSWVPNNALKDKDGNGVYDMCE